MIVLEGLLSDELLRISRLRSPHEAVGVILSNRRVVEVENHSPNPGNSFEITKADLWEAVKDDPNPEDIVLWHSHPGGGIGPSKVDLNATTGFKSRLIVTLIENQPVYSWY